MGKRKKRKQKETNAHHVLFQRKHWTSSKAEYLRQQFVYQVNVEQHDRLHKYVLHDVPIPRDLDNLFELARQDYYSIKFFNMRQGLEWLYDRSSDSLFRECISRQYEFFFNKKL